MVHKRNMLLVIFSFNAETLVNIALTTGSGRRFLYVQHANDGGITILDVTNPSKPVCIGSMGWPDGAKLGELTFLGDYAIGEMFPVRDIPYHVYAEKEALVDEDWIVSS